MTDYLKHPIKKNIPEDVRRYIKSSFYTGTSFILEPELAVRSGWKGRPTEKKRFDFNKGSLLVLMVKPDNWTKPSLELPVAEHILTRSNPFLDVPEGHVVSIKALEPRTQVEVFSFISEGSNDDLVKFDSEY